MSVRPLQSSLGNRFGGYRAASYVLWGAIGVGLCAVLVGAADVASRVAQNALGDKAGQVLFAPAGAIGNPDILNAVQGAVVPAEFVPVRLAVPSVGVNAAVVAVGVRADGAMETPKKFDEIAWYSLGSKPGGEGNAVFAGHVNNGLLQAGVFGHLNQVRLGEYVTVADAEGRTLVYRVQAIDQYPADEAPAAEIFSTNGPSVLVLITCDGDWVPAEKTFDKRLVIRAVPVYQ